MRAALALGLLLLGELLGPAAPRKSKGKRAKKGAGAASGRWAEPGAEDREFLSAFRPDALRPTQFDDALSRLEGLWAQSARRKWGADDLDDLALRGQVHWKFAATLMEAMEQAPPEHRPAMGGQAEKVLAELLEGRPEHLFASYQLALLYERSGQKQALAQVAAKYEAVALGAHRRIADGGLDAQQAEALEAVRYHAHVGLGRALRQLEQSPKALAVLADAAPPLEGGEAFEFGSAEKIDVGEGSLDESERQDGAVMRRRQPCRLRSTEAQRLVEAGRFTPGELGRRVKQPWSGLACADRFFVDAHPRPVLPKKWNELADANHSNAQEREVSLPPAEFFRQSRGSEEYYHISAMMEGGPDERPFVLRERGVAHPFQPNAGPIMRIGNEGYAHQAHYDNKHNVFVQLHGRKRFRLFPVAAASAKLSLYPSTHTLHRKSMVNFDFVNTSLFPDFEGIEGDVEVDLEPGDALYIPPFVPHHVTALTDDCIGFNTFSVGRVSQLSDVLQEMARVSLLPERTGWPVIGVPLYHLSLHLLLLDCGIEPRRFVEDWLRYRFEPLREVSQVEFLAPEDAGFPHSEDGCFRSGSGVYPAPFDQGLEQSEAVLRESGSIEAVAKTMRRMGEVAGEAGVRLSMQFFVEENARRVLRTERLVPFLRACLGEPPG